MYDRTLVSNSASDNVSGGVAPNATRMRIKIEGVGLASRRAGYSMMFVVGSSNSAMQAILNMSSS